MKKQLYFKEFDSEMCYTKEYFVSYINEKGLKELEVYEAEKEKCSGVFWCKINFFYGDDSAEYCGKQCDNYKPRNGKSGCCKHYTTTLYTKGKKIKL